MYSRSENVKAELIFEEAKNQQWKGMHVTLFVRCAFILIHIDASRASHVDNKIYG